MATMGGARVLGLDREIGSLETGKRADLIVVGVNRARQTPLYDPISHLVYASRGDDVETTIVNGQVLMRDRKVRTLDEASVLAKRIDSRCGFSRQWRRRPLVSALRREFSDCATGASILWPVPRAAAAAPSGALRLDRRRKPIPGPIPEQVLNRSLSLCHSRALQIGVG
jgi:hypothetical protein